MTKSGQAKLSSLNWLHTKYLEIHSGKICETLPVKTPLIGEINSFSKIAVTFEPMMQFWYSLRLRMPYFVKHSLFMTQITISTILAWRRRKARWGMCALLSMLINEWTSTVFVAEPLALPGSVKNSNMRTRD